MLVDQICIRGGKEMNVCLAEKEVKVMKKGKHVEKARIKIRALIQSKTVPKIL